MTFLAPSPLPATVDRVADGDFDEKETLVIDIGIHISSTTDVFDHIPIGSISYESIDGGSHSWPAKRQG
jgi:hypothetical protein